MFFEVVDCNILYTVIICPLKMMEPAAFNINEDCYVEVSLAQNSFVCMQNSLVNTDLF